MPAETLDPTNAQINRVLLVVREQLRAAMKPGSYGDWTGSVPINNGNGGKWRSGFIPSIDLTQAVVSGKK